jgi:lambda repressor-like predicted transcriptional regulator
LLHYCILLNEMDRREAVVAYLERAGVSQAELAKRAQVSQSTVSRARSRAGARQGRAQARLFTFIHQAAEGELHPALRNALTSAWDRSDAHAEALAALIAASRALWPELRERADDDE